LDLRVVVSSPSVSLKESSHEALRRFGGVGGGRPVHTGQCLDRECCPAGRLRLRRPPRIEHDAISDRVALVVD